MAVYLLFEMIPGNQTVNAAKSIKMIERDGNSVSDYRKRKAKE